MGRVRALSSALQASDRLALGNYDRSGWMIFPLSGARAANTAENKINGSNHAQGLCFGVLQQKNASLRILEPLTKNINQKY